MPEPTSNVAIVEKLLHYQRMSSDLRIIAIENYSVLMFAPPPQLRRPSTIFRTKSWGGGGVFLYAVSRQEIITRFGLKYRAHL